MGHIRIELVYAWLARVIEQEAPTSLSGSMSLIVYILFGWSWVPLIIDVVFLATKGHILLASDLRTETVDAKPKEEKKEDENKEE